MKWDVLNHQGKKVSEIELSDDIYNQNMNEAVLHTVAKAQLANKRQGTHATKTRSTVRGSGKKPFKQKGTGSARQGCTRSPLMPGGATSHGPQPRDYRQGVNKKVNQLAVKVALSDKARHQKLIIVDDLHIDAYSTKKVLGLLSSCQVSGKALIADERKDDLLYRSSKNIHGVESINSSNLCVLDLLKYPTLVLSLNAVKQLQKRLEGTSHESL